MLFLSIVTQGLFFLVISYFALYVVLELRVVLISKRVERKKLSSIELLPTPVDDNNLPKVSVLLPVCNESDVVERLIDAVCGLVYPTRLLEILVLDDSTDRTTSLAAARVAGYAASGINIRLLKREDQQNRRSIKF